MFSCGYLKFVEFVFDMLSDWNDGVDVRGVLYFHADVGDGHIILTFSSVVSSYLLNGERFPSHFPFSLRVDSEDELELSFAHDILVFNSDHLNLLKQSFRKSEFVVNLLDRYDSHDSSVIQASCDISQGYFDLVFSVSF